MLVQDEIIDVQRILRVTKDKNNVQQHYYRSDADACCPSNTDCKLPV